MVLSLPAAEHAGNQAVGTHGAFYSGNASWPSRFEQMSLLLRLEDWAPSESISF